MDAEDIEKLMRPALSHIKPYEPVEPPDVLSKNININEEDLVKIDANENPYGCSPRVRTALAEYPYINLYPDPLQRKLRKELENYTGFKSENIIAGSGSDELIELILKLFLEPGEKVINCVPTFGMYSFCTEMCAGQIVDVKRKSDFNIDLSAIREAIDNRTKVIFIASPNNPSGNVIAIEDIMELVQQKILVVVDEAYYEFSGITCANHVIKNPNLLVLRTFSKWAGLAGLRVGYGIFHSNIIRHMIAIKQPYNVNIAAQVSAIESLKDIKYLKSTIDLIIAERERLFNLLGKFEWLEAYPSSSNFILCKVLTGKADEIHYKLKQKGIIIRYYNNPLLNNYIRISVGKPEHTDKLIEEMKKL